ncbi:MAG: hypothetical protein J6B68_03980 [Lachnospiraceae bacterium]|nr:hypothetical protein [Lachnospiraceae bacterium]
MNLNEKLKKLLGVTGLPVEQDEYTGKSDKYIIFVYTDEHPEAFADNQVTDDTVCMQIQLITPKNFNYFELKKEIRNLLEGADFFVTSIRSFLGDVYHGTEKTRQTVFEVTYTESRKVEE